MPAHMAAKAKNLRITREFLSYLNGGSSAGKLRIVRGHSIATPLGTHDIRGLVDIARADSEEIFYHLYESIEEFCKERRWQPLKSGREYFIDEYLSEDILLNVIPRDEAGIAIVRRTIQILS